MNTKDFALLQHLVNGVIDAHDIAYTPTCIFCGCNEEVHEPAHKKDCIYRKAIEWLEE